jgi:putative tricarboxylic transport membrane protein
MFRRLAAAAPFGLLGLAAMLLARDFPPIPGQVYGPALFPMALGAGLVLCAVLVALQAPVPAGPPATMRGRIAAVGAALVPLLVMLGWDVLGWPLMAFGLGTALLMLAGTRPVPALLAGVLVAALTWVIFAMVLRVPLPRGLLTFLPY